MADEDAEFAIDPFIDRHELHLICFDCSTVMAGVKSRWPDISASDVLFQFSDMRAIAIATPNQAHEVDWAAAAEHARASRPLAKLTKAYWKRHNEAVNCRAVYRSLLAKCGGNKQRAWTRLSSYYADELADARSHDRSRLVDQRLALRRVLCEVCGLPRPAPFFQQFSKSFRQGLVRHDPPLFSVGRDPRTQ